MVILDVVLKNGHEMVIQTAGQFRIRVLQSCLHYLSQYFIQVNLLPIHHRLFQLPENLNHLIESKLLFILINIRERATPEVYPRGIDELHLNLFLHIEGRATPNTPLLNRGAKLLVQILLFLEKLILPPFVDYQFDVFVPILNTHQILLLNQPRIQLRKQMVVHRAVVFSFAEIEEVLIFHAKVLILVDFFEIFEHIIMNAFVNSC